MAIKASKNRNRGSDKLLPLSLLVTALFVPLFIFRGVGDFDFWWWLSANLVLLLGLCFYWEPGYRDILSRDFSKKTAFKILLGLASALVLYGVFYVGNEVSRLILPFSGEQIGNVYLFKGDASHLRIALLMLLVIGPGEELFWRGVIQRYMENRFKPVYAYLLAALFYAGVHIPTGNFMLVMAALVCGLFWGFLYLRYRSLLLIILSHILWDLAVFILFPFST